MINNRISFGKIPSVIEVPNLLAIQTDSFEDFVQRNVHPAKRENKGLQAVFTANFPIFDNKENYRLDFIEYYIEKPRYSVVECLERGLTFATPLKGKLRLSTKDPETEEFVNSVEQEVYLGNLPFMTEKRDIYYQRGRESNSFTASPFSWCGIFADSSPEWNTHLFSQNYTIERKLG